MRGKNVTALPKKEGKSFILSTHIGTSKLLVYHFECDVNGNQFTNSTQNNESVNGNCMRLEIIQLCHYIFFFSNGTTQHIFARIEVDPIANLRR